MHHRNQQDSVIALTDGSGDISERYAYTAYGIPTITDTSGTARMAMAIGNPDQWIHEAIHRAAANYRQHDLDVAIVSSGSSRSAVAGLVHRLRHN